MNQELENYIKQERSVGTNDETIKQKLRGNGWKDEMFNDYFSTPTTQQKPYLHKHTQKTKKHNKLIFGIIGAIVVLGAGAYFAFAQGLFNFSDNAVEEAIIEEIDEIKMQAQKILIRALAGEDFASLASEYSEDSGTAMNGGALNYATKGLLIPEFEKVIFEDLKIGEIYSELLESEFGYHIIKKIDQRLNVNGEIEVSSAHILFQKYLIKYNGKNENEKKQDIIEYKKREAEHDKALESLVIDIPNNWVSIDGGTIENAFLDSGSLDNTIILVPSINSDEEIYKGIKISIFPLADEQEGFSINNLEEGVNLFIEAYDLNPRPIINNDILKNNINVKEMIYDIETYMYVENGKIDEYNNLLMKDDEGIAKYNYFLINKEGFYLISFMIKDDLHTNILNSINFIN